MPPLPRLPARRPWLLPGALLLFLSACGGQTGGTGTGAGGGIFADPGTRAGAGAGAVLAGMSRARAPLTARIARGRVSVAGPPGFCVERRSRLGRRGGGFIALGQCASISGNPADATVPHPALLTVSAIPLSAPGQASPEALEDHFRRGAGREQAQSVERHGEAVFVQVRDDSPQRPEGLNDTYWRAFYRSGNHLISLSVSSLAEAPITRATGRRLLKDFLAAMQRANGAEP